MSFWTPGNLKIALEELARCTPAEAAENVSAALGLPFTYDSIDRALRRHGYGGISEHCQSVERLVEERRDRAEARSSAGLQTKLLAELADRDRQIETLTSLRRAASVKPIKAPKRKDGDRRHGMPWMLCSDWHVEETVHPSQVNGLNEYSLEIADKCIDRMADAFEWMLRDTRYQCREGGIWLGGDLFSGYIHAELAEGNSLSPVESVVWLQERIERMLRKILATTDLERLIVPCNDGNHGRLTQKMRCATRTANSLEWLLYKTLAARLSNEPRVQFQIAEGEWNYLDVYDQTLGFFHGDSVRYLGGVGGLLIPMNRGLNEIRKYRKVDHISFGHFHTRLDLPEVSGNGSMIGLTPYSMSIKAKPEPRQQSWFMIDSERGKCLSAPIWL